MRDLNLEAAIWNFFTSPEFYEAAAQECEKTMEWFGTLAVARQVANFGRNNQIFDKFKQRAREIRKGAELAKLGDYRFLWDISDSIRGDTRGFMEQALHSWMTDAEEKEFSNVRLSRILAYSSQITRALNNAMVAADCFFDPDPDCPERANDDDGFPGDNIAQVYRSYANYYEKGFWQLPTSLPEYRIDPSISCRTGEDVPRTGVWYPDTGLEHHSLTFAIKGLRMPPAFRVTKTEEELQAEGIWGGAETVAVATTWHPVVPSGAEREMNQELWSKAGQPCPRAGIWQPTDPGAAQRAYERGEPMANLGSAYGLTVWRWLRSAK
ncbi:hypothetical protein [Massilia varians]|uniref:hypothetical protein n=1 Tax=Massilia varians TaxID=457921 RepID=UPI002555C5A5|nr:hypothetical protein [Massilia varians]MDK6078636.1 hypothetical protein [Massilia varians]